MKSDLNVKAPLRCLTFEEMEDGQELEMMFDWP
jgi:hypothetical protein